jgi:geranylgeranyl transferase type-2 subunit beta
MSYLLQLTLRLHTAAERLPAECRRRHADYLRAAQRADGGFAGRRGESDPYYTSFGLRGLALLGALDETTAQRCAEFLVGQLKEPPEGVDFFSLVFAALIVEGASGVDPFTEAGVDRTALVEEKTAALKRPDGGYAKSPRSPHSSTYHTFLAVSCRQLAGVAVEDRQAIVDLMRDRQRDDGGFVELPQLAQGATNPTAAAIALLQSFDAIDPVVARQAAAFLAGMQNVEGGFRANTKIPVADLLSTFSAAATLDGLAATEAVDRAAVGRYAEGLEASEGGYRGGAWDEAADVEYTFYGLGTAALAAAAEA